MGSIYGHKIVTDGLVLYLDAANTKSYPTSGDTWYDLSSSGKNGTLTNSPSYNTDNCGSLVFDGIDDWVDCRSFDVLPVPTTLSVFSWFNMTGGAGTYRTIVHSGVDGAVGTSRYWIGISAAGNLVATIGAYTSGLDWNSGDLGITGTLDTWWNVGATYDGSLVKVYLNGEYKKQYNLSEYDGVGPTKLGKCVIDTGTGYIITGKISNVMVYHNKALTQQEITQNYNALKGRFGL